MEENVMLVLSRKVGEAIHIDGQIKVTVVRISGNRVKIGVEAPDDVHIIRKELSEWHEFSFGVPRSTESNVEQECSAAVSP